MIILHAGVDKGKLLLWGETAPEQVASARRRSPTGRKKSASPAPFPYGASPKALAAALLEAGVASFAPAKAQRVVAWLPTRGETPAASSSMIAEPPARGDWALRPWAVDVYPLAGAKAIELLCASMGKELLAPGLVAGKDLAFWALAMQFAGSLAARQRFLPGLAEEGETYRACWDPVLGAQEEARLTRLAEAMPDSCRALGEDDKSPPSAPPRDLLQEFVGAMVDQLVRASQQGAPTTAKVWSQRRHQAAHAQDSVHDQWLHALQSEDGGMEGEAGELAAFAAQMQAWRRPLALTLLSPFRLCFRLEEPAAPDRPERKRAVPKKEWQVRYLLQAADDPSLLAPAKMVWSPRGKRASLLHREGFDAREHMLTCLGQAASICPRIAGSLRAAAPEGCELDANGAHEFLTRTAPALEQAGFGVMLPAWWTGKGSKLRLTARGQAKSPALQSAGHLSLDAILEVNWEVALGGEAISIQELEALAAHKASLVSLRGQWVETNAQDIRAAVEFLAKRSATSVTLRELMQMALGATRTQGSLEVDGVTADGWAGDLLTRLQDGVGFEEVSTPRGFSGRLRPYQERGYSWLCFLRRWGLGACLADDMGLGKTIQALALIQRDWEQNGRRPSLLICPTSVVQNWQKEAARFTPDLPVLVHHGLGRKKGERFREEAEQHALVISSYALLHRDFEVLRAVPWAGLLLDEAQNVKNPEAKQSRAARGLPGDYRVALTGTPVENSVGDLWAIMEFLNPGFLGSQAKFKRSFFVPIQAQRDRDASERLKRLTGPFILRRLKTEKSVISDLPEKLEFKVFCTLTKEQASLYAAVAKEAAESLEETEGIQRKGVILATLSKLKQVCNHPAHFLKDNSTLPGRSGKLARLTEMLEEVLAVGERSLIFSQFAEMGELLRIHLQDAFGQEVFFLHGGVPKKRRDEMVERFQEKNDSPRLFILSLKAGGTGLNLTQANHVFHFDRWWNPAVENQATDRAFRIGQTRNVQVHKFLCAGTLEEKIDEMIERKKEVAQQVVGAGESWLTKLSTAELKDLFALRKEAVSE